MSPETASVKQDDVQLPDLDKLVISSSPHLHSGENVARIMVLVILALLPACATGVYFFGLDALRVLLITTFGCVLFEALFCRMMGRKAPIGDFSALLTGLLLGMNLSASTPSWICIIGAGIAMGLGKHLFGGLGYNPFNPALVARVALIIAFPKHLTTWVAPVGATAAGKVIGQHAVDAVSTATPLSAVPTALAAGNSASYEYFSYFIGRIGGCIGETSALALLIGGLILIALKLIRWQIPLAFISTVVCLTALLHNLNPDIHPTPLFHLLVGGLFLGAFFMATDMVTSPMSKLGAIIFGVGCGLITTVIRVWGSYPEGVSFAILFMNALAPLIDRYTGRRPFGAQKA